MMIRSITAALALACLVAACGRFRQGDRTRPENVVVDVLNENFYEARIHAVYDGGQRRSLGTLPGNGGRERVELAWEPRSLIFEVQFVTEGSAYVTHPVDVSPGESLELRVPSNISQSGFFRRVRR